MGLKRKRSISPQNSSKAATMSSRSSSLADRDFFNVPLDLPPSPPSRPQSPTPSRSFGVIRDPSDCWPFKPGTSTAMFLDQSEPHAAGDDNLDHSEHPQVPNLARLAARHGQDNLMRMGNRSTLHLVNPHNESHDHLPFVASSYEERFIPAPAHHRYSLRGSPIFNVFRQQENRQQRRNNVRIKIEHLSRYPSHTADNRATISAVRDATRLILNDVRAPSRLENRTSLPIRMPNAISPIDTANIDFDAGCGAPVEYRVNYPITTNPFNSPPTTTSRSTSSRFRNIFRFGPFCFGGSSTEPSPTRKTFISHDPPKKNRSRQKMVFWTAASTFFVASLSAACAVTSIATSRRREEPIEMDQIAWLVISLVFAVSFAVMTVYFYCCLQPLDRLAEVNDEEWIEMNERVQHNHCHRHDEPHRRGHDQTLDRPLPRVVTVTDFARQREELRQTDQAAQNQAWKKFTQDEVRLRRYVEYLEEKVAIAEDAKLPLSAKDVTSRKDGSGANVIGLARSTSLYATEMPKAGPKETQDAVASTSQVNESAKHQRNQSITSVFTVGTASSGSTIRLPTNSFQQSVQDFVKADASGKEDGKASLTDKTNTTQPGPTADTSMISSVTNSTSHGTVSSILDSYANCGMKVDTTLQSISQPSIETEAGTPYSQKSKRQHGGDGHDTWDWSSSASTMQGDHDGKNKTEATPAKENK